MLRVILIILFSLVVIGCASTTQPIPVQQHTVLIPPANYFQCEVVELPRNTRTITDLDVARLITRLYRENVVCANNIKAIKEFLENSSKILQN